MENSLHQQIKSQKTIKESDLIKSFKTSECLSPKSKKYNPNQVNFLLKSDTSNKELQEKQNTSINQNRDSS